MFYFYSPQLHHRFTDRQRELAVLAYAVEELRQGRPHHLAFFGLRKIGKTSLLKEFAYRLLTEAQADSEIARRQKVAAATARDYLRWLKEVDLITEREGGHYYCDPVLRFWVANVTAGIEIVGPPRREVLEVMVRHLDERYQQATTELGLAKESQVRELLCRFAGQEVDGALLGLPCTVHLPTFQKVAPYQSDDGQIEVDALAEGDERWAVEIKWRGKLAGLKEVQKLVSAAQALSARPWFISRTGFTTQAEAYAQQEGIMYSSREEIEALARVVAELA